MAENNTTNNNPGNLPPPPRPTSNQGGQSSQSSNNEEERKRSVQVPKPQQPPQPSRPQTPPQRQDSKLAHLQKLKGLNDKRMGAPGSPRPQTSPNQSRSRPAESNPQEPPAPRPMPRNQRPPTGYPSRPPGMVPRNINNPRERQNPRRAPQQRPTKTKGVFNRLRRPSSPKNLIPENQKQNRQKPPMRRPLPRKAQHGHFGNLSKFGPQQAPQPRNPKADPRYLRSLNKEQLKQEVIKTQIEIEKALIESQKKYAAGIKNIKDLIAPSGIKIETGKLGVGTKLVRSLFVLTYPRVISSGWLEGLVNADMPLDLAIFIYPKDSGKVLKDLKKKVGKIEASLQINAESGKARDPALETAYQDVEQLRDAIQQGVEKFYSVGVYVTIYSDTEDELERNTKTVEDMLSRQNIIAKRAALQMDDGFTSTLPLLKDDLDVHNNLNTSPLSACFPFVSSDLSSDDGILYGINRHNTSLIIFDRFELENANSVIFATSGAGKSYTVKLEILRSLMIGTSVIVIDPENEYKMLADTVGGTYINLSLNSINRINPFDLPKPLKGESNADILRSAIIDLIGLINLMVGKLDPNETSLMERAIKETYATRDITEEADFSNINPPTMGDLVDVLQGIVGGESLAQRLYRYTEGTFAGIFNQPTNINADNDFIVFNIRDLQDQLRPIAMYILLKYIWNEIRSEKKKRLLVVDEAWVMMQNEDSAKFLFGLVKRARKYYLGVTTITQDVGDFLASPYGKPIVTNSAMKVLLKQSTAAIDQIGEIFALTEGEKQVLLQSSVGQGIFFAGPRHVAIEIIAFPTEHKIITTNPSETTR